MNSGICNKRRKIRNSTWIAAICLAALTGCSQRETLPSPATAPALQASCFDVTADSNAVHLLIGKPVSNNSVQLFYLRHNPSNTNWPAPVAIPTEHAIPGNHHRGNDPQIAADGDHLLALWTARGGGPFGSGPLATARSFDGGQTWQPGPNPKVPGDQTNVGYRFPATVAGNGAFHVVWIHAEGEERSLRYSQLPYGARQWSEPVIVDATCCACCWNELKIAPDGTLYALYRDESPRDMALAVSKDGGATWTRTGPVGDFKWDFNGCPHVGGGLALISEPANGSHHLWATIWSGQNEHAGAYVLGSSDGGQTWNRMIRLGATANTLGRHTDAAAQSANYAAIAWDASSKGEQTVFAAVTRNGGHSWSAPRALSQSVNSSKYPRIVPFDDRFLVFWSEYPDEGLPLLKMEWLQ